MPFCTTVRLVAASTMRMATGTVSMVASRRSCSRSALARWVSSICEASRSRDSASVRSRCRRWTAVVMSRNARTSAPNSSRDAGGSDTSKLPSEICRAELAMAASGSSRMRAMKATSSEQHDDRAGRDGQRQQGRVEALLVRAHALLAEPAALAGVEAVEIAD